MQLEMASPPRQVVIDPPPQPIYGQSRFAAGVEDFRNWKRGRELLLKSGVVFPPQNPPELPPDRPINCVKGDGTPVNTALLDRVIGNGNMLSGRLLGHSNILGVRSVNGIQVPDFKFNNNVPIREQIDAVRDITSSATRLYLDIGTSNEPPVWSIELAQSQPGTVILAVDPTQVEGKCDDTHPIMRPDHIKDQLIHGSSAIQLRIASTVDYLVDQKGFGHMPDRARFVAPTPGMLSSLDPLQETMFEKVVKSVNPQGEVVVIANVNVTSNQDIHALRAEDISNIYKTAEKYNRNIREIKISPWEMGIWMDPYADQAQKAAILAKYGPKDLYLIGPASSSYIFYFPETRGVSGDMSKADPRPLTVYILESKDREKEEDPVKFIESHLLELAALAGVSVAVMKWMLSRMHVGNGVGDPPHHRMPKKKKNKKQFA